MEYVEFLSCLYSEGKHKISVDVETNTRPQVNFTSKYLKFFHVIAQALKIRKVLTLEDITKDPGTNTIYGISELWFDDPMIGN